MNSDMWNSFISNTVDVSTYVESISFPRLIYQSDKNLCCIHSSLIWIFCFVFLHMTAINVTQETRVLLTFDIFQLKI